MPLSPKYKPVSSSEWYILMDMFRIWCHPETYVPPAVVELRTHKSEIRFARNVEAEIVTIVIWEAGCLQIRLSNYKFLFLSHEIWKWMSWVPIMASLQANLKEIKRPTTLYIATRQMNWPPLSNWNPLFVQQTSVSLPNSCDIIDSNINDSAAHNWAWPTEWKYSHGTKAVDVTAKFTILICQGQTVNPTFNVYITTLASPKGLG